ncbi:MAG: MBL fold metallo-hydrolase [Chloroflexi bacterium]|nr:MBL fold metallo-hydrolase [Chloroflexota bacterium]
MIYQVGDHSGVYCIEGTGTARVYFVGAPDYTLIDAGVPRKADLVLSGLAQIGVQPLQVRRIILTHHHWDHVGSLWELKKRTGAKVLAHPRDADYISGKRVRRAPRQPLGRLMYTIFGLFGARDLPNVDVDAMLNDGDRVGSFCVIHTPGHTPGHICLLRDGYLFSGDLLMASAGEFHETPHIFTADVPTARASIRKVAQFKFEAILSSHHAPYVFGAAEKVGQLASKLGVPA